MAKRGPSWASIVRIVHQDPTTGDLVFDKVVTEENRDLGAIEWNCKCDFPNGLTTDIYYDGGKLSPPGEGYLERARLKRERKKQKYDENQAQRIKAAMLVWSLHEWNIPSRSGTYHQDAKGRWRLNKMFKEMPVNDKFQVQILASSVWDPPRELPIVAPVMK